MFLETLENLFLTWNLRQSFQELVEAYLEIMEYPGSEGKIHLNNHFLVISLDDLDMNMAHGYELLEEVRKYLMVLNVDRTAGGQLHPAGKALCGALCKGISIYGKKDGSTGVY